MSEQKSSLESTPLTVEEPTTEEEDQSLTVSKDDQSTIAQCVITPSTELPRRPVDANSKNFDFKNPSQTVCLVNIAHKNQKLKSDTAALRILGAFKNNEKALKHSKKIQGDLDVFVLPMHSWFPITQSPVPPEKAAEIQAKTVEKVEKYVFSCAHKHEDVQKDASAEFCESRIEESRKIWEQGEKLQKDLNDATTDPKDDIEDVVSSVPRDQEIRGQNYAVISIVGEASMDDEPAINILRMFETKEDARDYLRNTIHIERIVTNCYVVQMYEWITPALTHTQKFFENIDASFTHTQLEQLYSGKKEERKKIENILAKRGKTLEDIDEFMKQKELEMNTGGEEEGESKSDEGIAIVPVEALDAN